MTQATHAAQPFACPHCGQWLHDGVLACPSCGGLVYSGYLHEIAASALREEPADAERAAQIWQQALRLLPPDSLQYEQVRQRIAALLGGAQSIARGPAASEGWARATTKTGISMLISIIVYAFLFAPGNLVTGLFAATGFVLLILVHEMGHVLAMRWYGLSASPPIFIPLVGALINLREQPRNAWEEAVIGIGGPVLGTAGAILCYYYAVHTQSTLALALAEVAFFLNLFNLVPLPPLDGGRVMAAVSPWLWIFGFCAILGWLAVLWFTRNANFIVIMVMTFMLMTGWRRIRSTLIARGRNSPYYDIGWRATVTMGTAYVLLAGVLGWFFFHTRAMLPGGVL